MTHLFFPDTNEAISCSGMFNWFSIPFSFYNNVWL